MAWAQPDEVIDHYRAGACGCGTDLAAAADLGVARSFQQLEAPLITARRVQHDLHQARCGGGTVHAAARPEGVGGPPVSIGPNLRALAVYLVVFQHVPAQRCARLIADVTGAGVSAGFVHSCLARAARLVADVVKLIKTLITAACVAASMRPRCAAARPGPRSTCWRPSPSGTRCSSWAATLESFRDFGVLPAFAGVVVSGRHVNYFHDGWEHIAGNQACLAHLIRDYQDPAECCPGAIWPVQAQRALHGLTMPGTPPATPASPRSRRTSPAR